MSTTESATKPKAEPSPEVSAHEVRKIKLEYIKTVISALGLAGAAVAGINLLVQIKQHDDAVISESKRNNAENEREAEKVRIEQARANLQEARDREALRKETARANADNARADASLALDRAAAIRDSKRALDEVRRANDEARRATDAASLSTYQAIAASWNQHLQIFVRHPELRPYFYERRPSPSGEQPDRGQVLAVADVRIDIMDALLTYAQALPGDRGNYAAWDRTFETAFRESPVLCARYFETSQDYGLIQRAAEKGCGDALARPGSEPPNR